MTRINCCIPFCRRTFADDGSTEVICGKHWRLAPKTWRRRHTKLVRRYRKHHGDRGYWEYEAGSPKRLDCVRLHTLINKLWDRCKTAAIEAAGGI